VTNHVVFLNHTGISYCVFISHLTTALLNGSWVPRISSGFHVWQPAPRLNNAPMAGPDTTSHPSHEPLPKETDTCTLKYRWKEKGGGREGEKLAEETSQRTMLDEKPLMLPDT